MTPSLTGGDAQGEAASPSGLSLRWQRAAMLGSLWAANEIVLGSFLHNVGVPFAGTLLACIGVLLLVAGHRLWNDPGVIWRAGVICSLMKSISPSSVILGPMVGILAESGLVFLCIVLFRGLFIGSLLGGMLAAMTPILQKIISVVVAYGMDAARMYASLFTLLSDRMQLHSVDAKEALIVLIALQAIPGALAALAGIAIARGVSRVCPVSAREEAPALQGGRQEASNTPHRYSLTALGMHTLLLPAGLALLPSLPPLLTPAPVAAYLSAVLLRYPGLRVRFKRLRLWLEFGAVAILAGVLLGVLAPGGKGTWWSGLQSGIAMAARATLVVAAFSAISVELRNPTVLNWFLQRGLGNVSAALSAAFRVLPVMIQALQQQRTGFRHPLRSLSRMLATMLAQIQENPEERAQPAVCILTGNQGEGKTTLLHRVAGRLRSEGIAVGGILAHVRSAGTERTGYDVEDLMTGERTTLCRTGQTSGGHSVGPFVVLQEGLSLGARALAVAREIPGAVVVVDEVGPLELRGEGWATPAKDLLSSGVAAVVFVVRRTLVHQVQEQWRFRARHVWDVRQTNEEQILGALRPMVRAGSASPDDGVRAG